MHGHELLEGLAAIALVGSGALLVPAAWVARRRALAMSDAHQRASPAAVPSAGYVLRAARIAIGSLAVGAAVIHLAVALQPTPEIPAHAIARTAAAVVLLGVVALTGRLDRMRAASVAVPLAVIGVWSFFRATGFQIGPEPWPYEAVGVADGAAIILELMLAMTIIACSFRGSALGRRSSVRAGLLSVAVIPLIGAAGIATLVALASLGEAAEPHAPHSVAPATVIDRG